jgi:hypothetical protein
MWGAIIKVAPAAISAVVREADSGKVTGNSISNSMMISRRLGGGDEAYYTYVEEADDDANKGST